MHDSWMESAGMVRVWARRLRRTGFSTDELFTIGLWGLYQAAEKYDPTRGVKFESFALPRVRGEILDWMKRNQRPDWMRPLYDQPFFDRVAAANEAREYLESQGVDPDGEAPPGPRNRIMVTHNGLTMPISGWAKRLGVDQCTIRRRIAKHGAKAIASFLHTTSR